MPPTKTHCPKGHEFSDENTYTDARGYRHCRRCRRDRMRARRNYSGKGPGSKNAAKTHCPKGHEYTEENTYWSPSKTAKSGYGRTCRECNRLSLREKNFHRYGITRADADQMVVNQGGGCAICGNEFESSRDRHIDHDHACCPAPPTCGGCNRGILCSACNRGLGNFRDDIDFLRAAVRYLEGQE